MLRLPTRPALSLLLFGILFAASLQQAMADPRDFTLNNSTGEVISNVYVGPSTSTDWGSDVLGRDILNPGQTMDVTFSNFISGDCQYDIKVVTQSGREGYLYKIDLCSTSTVTFN